MTWLVTGTSGQLGFEICRLGRQSGHDPIGLPRAELDLSRPQTIKLAMDRHHPSLVVNCAAYTAVDRAESEPEAAFAANRDGPAELARLCARAGIPLIHISTDYVFDGSQSRPYSETDPLAPLGVYGRSKAAGEEAIRSELAEHVIIRTAWLYGVRGQNFVITMLRLGLEKDALAVVDDQIGSPTYASDLAEAVLTVAAGISTGQSAPWGVYHYAGGGQASRFDWVSRLFELVGPHLPLQIRILKPAASGQFPAPAPRPPFSALNSHKIQTAFNVRVYNWDSALERMLRRYLRYHCLHAHL